MITCLLSVMTLTFETWACMQVMWLLTPLFSMLIKTSANLEFLSITLLHEFSMLCFSNQACVISIRSMEYFSIIIYLRVVILVLWMQSRAHRAESIRSTTTQIWLLKVFVIWDDAVVLHRNSWGLLWLFGDVLLNVRFLCVCICR